MDTKYKNALVAYKNLQISSIYKLQPHVIGIGSFGAVMLCKVHNSSDICVAKIVNFENNKHKNSQNILKKEVDIYRKLVAHKKVKPFLIKMYSLVNFNNNNNHACQALITDYAGKDLDKILKDKGQYAFSRSQLLKIGLKLIPALEAIHSCNIVHRDIKPANIVLRLSKSKNIFVVKLIDYGLATTWAATKEPPRMKRGAGTPRFCGWKQHFGFNGSPCRDVESLIYTLIYLSGTKLPWHGLKISDLKQKTRTIGYTKRDASSKVLCANFDLDLHHPTSTTHESHAHYTSLSNILDTIRLAKYSEIPNYEKIHDYFKKSLDQSTENDSFSSNSISCPKPKPKRLKRLKQVDKSK